MAGMNRDRIEGRWKQLTGAWLERWGELTADGLRVVAGRHDQHAGRMQERYGLEKEEAQRQLKAFLRRNRRWNTTSR